EFTENELYRRTGRTMVLLLFPSVSLCYFGISRFRPFALSRSQTVGRSVVDRPHDFCALTSFSTRWLRATVGRLRFLDEVRVGAAAVGSGFFFVRNTLDDEPAALELRLQARVAGEELSPVLRLPERRVEADADATLISRVHSPREPLELHVELLLA